MLWRQQQMAFIFWHFVFSATSPNVHPSQLTLSPIHNHKIKSENTFSKNCYGTSYTKNYVILSKCDNVIKNIQIHMPWRVFFFLVWNFAQMWKNKMRKEYLVTFFFWRKKPLDLQKIKNHIETFAYWFWFGKLKKKFK